METFFLEDDYMAYPLMISEWCRKCNVAICAYYLIPNHIHVIAVPESEDGLRHAKGKVHRRYTLMINRHREWIGHWWQG